MFKLFPKFVEVYYNSVNLFKILYKYNLTEFYSAFLLTFCSAVLIWFKSILFGMFGSSLCLVIHSSTCIPHKTIKPFLFYLPFFFLGGGTLVCRYFLSVCHFISILLLLGYLNRFFNPQPMVFFDSSEGLFLLFFSLILFLFPIF